MNNSTLAPIKSRLRLQGHTFLWFLFWLAVLVYFEVLLHAVAFSGFSLRFLYVLGFSAAFAVVLALIQSFLPGKGNFVVSLLFTVLLLLLYGSEMVYYFIFGTLYSVSQMGLGGAAITSFWRELLAAMWERLPTLLLLLVPTAAIVLIRILRKKAFAVSNAFSRVLLVVLAVVTVVASIQCLKVGGTGYFTTYYFYHSEDTTTDQAADRFGLLTALRLELTGSGSSGDVGGGGYYVEPTPTPAPSVPEDSTADPEPSATEEPEPVIEYNVLDIDFDALSQLTDDETILALNQYCASLAGTTKNEYTGLLEGYNLIVICAESFSTAAIHPEVTPTLYRLANEGILFNNYYNTFPNTTTDGEYTLCLGLYPDGSRGKSDASFRASGDNYLPYALGNLFSQQLGIQSYGYHNYKGTYYDRVTTHANMGYSMKFAGAGMRFTNAWPASDLEMMEQSIDDYLSQDQFHAYYMTFSGHYRYDITTNNIALGNWPLVEDLDYSEAARAYLSCHIELDKALAYLMERLEEEGVADRTAIVLAGDHFPYGLYDSQYSELVGYDIDSFTKHKSSLIFWVGGLEENIVVDEYCCNADVLPTILNLWGFEYDSRLLAGTDVFSDGTHVAILRDYSFFTDKVWFNASTGKVRYLVDESELPENYVENMIRLVKTKYSVSTDILNTDYYRFLFSNLEPESAPADSTGPGDPAPGTTSER